VATGIMAVKINDAWSPALTFTDSEIATRLVYEVDDGEYTDIHMLTLYRDDSMSTEVLASGISSHQLPALPVARVAWTGSLRPQGQGYPSDIYLREMGKQSWVSVNPSVKTMPTIVGTRVAWSDNRSGSSGAAWYDMVSFSENELTEAAGLRFEGLSGTFVLWSDPLGAVPTMWAKDLLDDSVYTLTTDLGQGFGMTFTGFSSAGDAVWMNTSAEVIWNTLPPGPDTVVPVTTAIPLFDMSGTVLVWTNAFGDKSIHCYDLATDQGGLVTPAASARVGESGVANEKDLVLTRISGPDDYDVFWCRLQCTNNPVCNQVQLTVSGSSEGSADVDDGMVVWTTNARQTVAPSPSDVVIHNLATRETMTITRATDSLAGKSYPRIHQGRIVWEDERTGGLDIFYYEYPR
jgi:hypothetical protein